MVDTAAEQLRGQRALWRIEPRIPEDVTSDLPGQSVMLSHLLWCRGFRTSEQIAAFYAGARISHDPFLLPDMPAAVERIARAAETGEHVAVYGDFDCDGVTAAAVLMETLRGVGLHPVVYIPERSDGHGLTPEALAALVDQGVTLVVTADCGIVAIEEVLVAQGMGLDVVITDHHEARPDGSLPGCPTVAPTRHDSQYPFRSLCGAGVAYKLAQALALALPAAPDPEHTLDLVALGTVADVVPLLNENRSIVIAGLQQLRRTERAGLLALFQAAGIDRSRIDPVSISFYLAPRINAANRLATPRLAYDLITATDPDVAAGLAAQLNALNAQRQALLAQCLERILGDIGPASEITEQVQTGARAPALITIGDWPAGVSGLLASKLAETYGLPAFVGTRDSAGTVAVSARGIPNVHIDEILERCEASVPGGIFIGHGGHSGAGGFRVPEERLELAIGLLEEHTRAFVPTDDLGAVLHVDAELTLSQLSIQNAQAIRSLAPFGTGFPEPLFLTRDAMIRRIEPRGESKPVRFGLQKNGSLIDGVYFGAEQHFAALAPGARIDAVFNLQINEWQNRVKPEIRLRDWRSA